MIHVFVSGGLGNQLFQAAFARRLGRDGHKVSLFSTLPSEVGGTASRSLHLDRIFPDGGITTGKRAQVLHRLALSRLKSIPYIYNVIDLSEQPTLSDALRYLELRASGVTVLYGYYQFAELAVDLAFRERVRYGILEAASEALPSVLDSADFDRDCIVHVRGGDYVSHGFPLDPDYYIRALKRMRTRGFTGRVYAMTDDPDHCETTLEALDATLIDVLDPIASVSILSKFRWKVIANSTFSLWAGLIGHADQIVVIPRVWQFYDEEFSAIALALDWHRV